MKRPEKIELLCDGQQFIAFGTHPDTGQSYHWPYGKNPLDTPRLRLPPIAESEGHNVVDTLADLLIAKHGYTDRRGLKAGAAPEERRKRGRPSKTDDLAARIIAGGPSLHDAIRDLAFDMARRGVAAGEIKKHLRGKMDDAANPRHDKWKEYYARIDHDVDSAIAKVRPEDGRPIIELAGDRLSQNVAAAATAIYQRDLIYQRSGILVRIRRLPAAEAGRPDRFKVARAAGTPQVYPLTQEWLRCAMQRTARFMKIDAEGYRHDRDPPLDYAKTLMALSGDWPFKPLLGIIEAPTLRHDGTVLQTEGYDPETSLFYAPGGHQFPAIPSNPDLGMAQKALAALHDPLSEFIFVSPADKAVIVAAILTALVRRTLPSAPMIGISAPTPGSGKTLLAKLISIIAIGRETPPISFTGVDEEERKRLIAMLALGDAIINFGNVERPLGGAALNSALTSEFIQERTLGILDMKPVPTNATFLADGNNLRLAGDLTRRTLLCQIDPGCERPDAREFKRDDLEAYVRQNRVKLVSAGLTIMRAYIAAGRPKVTGMRPYGGFEEWSNLVRAAMVWAGSADPCLTREQIEGNDPVVETLFPLLEALHRTFRDGTFTSAWAVDLVQRADNPDTYDAHGDLRRAMAGALPKGVINAGAMGHYLKRHRGRWISGLRIIAVETGNRVVVWKISEQNNDKV